MIPRKIHYCWFGGNVIPDSACKCIDSWKKYCPDYEIIQWDESNFDINSSFFTKEAYEEKKWAFITDYVRLYVLSNYGGIYMDTDVELCKPLDDFLIYHAFTGFESQHLAVTGIIASEKNNEMINKLLRYYDDKHFRNRDGSMQVTTNTEIITKIVCEEGLILNNTQQTVGTMTFFPNDYFCPKNFKDGIIYLTDRTVCIHHFSGSWVPKEQKKLDNMYRKLRRYGKIGIFLFKFYKYVFHPKILIKKIMTGEA